ncbi:MAG: hypothetical protein K5657_07050 [Desulfovibrio sp.]|nr:hypothetical protein [Desulfovibrio sp.]
MYTALVPAVLQRICARMLLLLPFAIAGGEEEHSAHKKTKEAEQGA